MVSTYVRAPGLPDAARDRCWQYWVVNHHVRSNIVAVDGKSEFLFNTRLDRPDQRPDEDTIAAAFRASVGADIGVEYIAHETWTAGQAFVTERFGAGRVWMAGDAVHLFTPTGGFGMNTGIDDAANLGWKLAAMVQGWGGPRLLPSYETERRPIALRNTDAAKALARNVGKTPVRPEIGDDTVAGQAARREAADYLSGGSEEFASSRRAAWRPLRRLADRRPGRAGADRRPRDLPAECRAGRPGPARLARDRPRNRRLAVRPSWTGLHRASPQPACAIGRRAASPRSVRAACRWRCSTS